MALREPGDRPVTKICSRPKIDTSEVAEIDVEDQRSEQAASVLQVQDTGRQIVMEVFEGVGLAPEKTNAILAARSRIADQWGKAKNAALLDRPDAAGAVEDVVPRRSTAAFSPAPTVYSSSRRRWQRSSGGPPSLSSNCGCRSSGCLATRRSTTWRAWGRMASPSPRA